MKKIKDHFAIIGGGSKIRLQWILKTLFGGADYVHITQDNDC